MTGLAKRIGTGMAVMSIMLSMPVQAETLSDPTRPPAGVEVYASHAGKPGRPAVREQPDRGLQFVMIAPGHKTAIIDGHEVRLGGKFGSSTVIAINEGSVVLRTAQGRKVVMTMFPGVNLVRKPVPPAPAAEHGESDMDSGHVPVIPVAQSAPEEEK